VVATVRGFLAVDIRRQLPTASNAIAVVATVRGFLAVDVRKETPHGE
jgi:hypothetical protein